MRLIVSGLPPHSDPNHFHALFGRYVYGFNPWTHCDNCFVKRQETAIHPKMVDGTYELQDHLFYLCAVGRDVSKKVHPYSARNNTNVHLAVRPRKGSVAAIGSVYGATFVIEDAQAIPIRAPGKEFPALLTLPEKKRESHAGCRMFHFAYQMFDVDQISLTRGDPVHQLRKEWIAMPGIRQDSAGRMIDPRQVR